MTKKFDKQIRRLLDFFYSNYEFLSTTKIPIPFNILPNKIHDVNTYNIMIDQLKLIYTRVSCDSSNEIENILPNDDEFFETYPIVYNNNLELFKIMYGKPCEKYFEFSYVTIYTDALLKMYDDERTDKLLKLIESIENDTVITAEWEEELSLCDLIYKFLDENTATKSIMTYHLKKNKLI